MTELATLYKGARPAEAYVASVVRFAARLTGAARDAALAIAAATLPRPPEAVRHKGAGEREPGCGAGAAPRSSGRGRGAFSAGPRSVRQLQATNQVVRAVSCPPPAPGAILFQTLSQHVGVAPQSLPAPNSATLAPAAVLSAMSVLLIGRLSRVLEARAGARWSHHVRRSFAALPQPEQLQDAAPVAVAPTATAAAVAAAAARPAACTRLPDAVKMLDVNAALASAPTYTREYLVIGWRRGGVGRVRALAVPAIERRPAR